MRRVPGRWIVVVALLLVVATTVLGIGPGKVRRLFRALTLLPKVAYYTKVGRALQEIRRTELVTDPVGRYYLALAYSYRYELFTALDQLAGDPAHDDLWLDTLDSAAPLILDFVETGGTNTTITPELVQKVGELISRVRAVAPPALQAAIDAELARFPLDQFAGMTPAQAWEHVRQHGPRLYGDIPFTPRPAPGDPRQLFQNGRGASVDLTPDNRPVFAWLHDNRIYVLEPGARPASVDPPAGTSNYDPDVAVDIDGTVHIAWLDDLGGRQDLYYTAKSPGGTWSPPRVLASQKGYHVPSLALDDRFVYIALSTGWVQVEKATGTVRTFESGLWGTKVDVDAAGTVHLAGETGEGVVHALADPDTGAIFEREVVALNHRGLSALRVAPDGTVHLVWANTSPDDRQANVFYAWGRPGEWHPPVQLSFDNFSLAPDVAVGPDGRTHVVWYAVGTGLVFYQVLEGGQPVGAPLYMVGGVAEAELPKVAVGTDGSVHVVWHQPWSFLPASDELGIFWWNNP